MFVYVKLCTIDVAKLGIDYFSVASDRRLTLNDVPFFCTCFSDERPKKQLSNLHNNHRQTLLSRPFGGINATKLYVVFEVPQNPILSR
jgi:hypothetical protein